MDNQSHQFSDLIPGDPTFLEGEYDIDAPFSMHCTEASRLGDLYSASVQLLSSFGNAEYSLLGTQQYFIEWGAYDLHGGMSMSASMRQSYVNLHFQLEGALTVEQPAGVIRTPLRAGENNLSFVPPFAGTFKLDDRNEGNAFSILLSTSYFENLSHRYPHLFEKHYNRMLRGEPFSLRDQHLHITPAMWGIIRRIQQRGLTHQAGSLFLEAQILELIALQFEQLDAPVRTHTSLSSDDMERIHEARDVLLRRLANPPTLAEVAQHVGTTEYKLKHGFKVLFGTSPYAYLLEHRLELARTCVLDTNWTIAEIAYHVGYSDPAHLTNAFRKQYGRPPSDLRGGPAD